MDVECVNVSIIEHRRQADSVLEVVHQGPSLILVYPNALTSTSTTPSAAAKRPSPERTSGAIVGMAFGILVGAILLGILLFMNCRSHCGGSYGFQQKSKPPKAKRVEPRRVQERAARPLDIDASNASVAHEVTWIGNGMWVMPLTRYVPRPAPRGSDEIRAAPVVEEQRVEEQRIQEQSVGQQRLEIARAEESELPDYEPPPKYTP